MHSKEHIEAVLGGEPADGTTLVVDYGNGMMVSISRDDDAARRYWRPDPPRGQHWFSCEDAVLASDPMDLHEHLKDARAVYALGPKVADLGSPQ